MSGGVDSSVAALLLKEQGHDITGVYFTPWKPENGKAFCDWEEDRRDAMKVATKLGINFKTWDLSKEYGEEVTQYMIGSYANGETPNPDILCNEKIKCGVFLEKALAEGADFIATGHYAKIEHTPNASYLKKARDGNKDQTYFLCRLKQHQLSKILFPLGDLLKSEVREIAKKNDLITHNKKDSQGVCFVGMLDMKDFLKDYIPPKHGDVILQETGEKIGEHDGMMYYTIGQRHGLNLKKDGGPYYVLNKDTENNIIYITTDEKKLDRFKIIIKNFSSTTDISFPLDCYVKVRYRGEDIKAIIAKTDEDGTYSITSETPMHAISKGQSAVIYKDDTVLGSGFIT